MNRPVITIAHILTTLGLFGSLLVFANDTENKVVENSAQLPAIVKNQDEMKKDFHDYQVQQQTIQMQQMQLLHEIKGKLEK